MKTLKELKKLAKQEVGGQKCKIALLGDTATQLLATALAGEAASRDTALNLYEGEYNQVERQLLDTTSEVFQFDADFLVIFQSTHKLSEHHSLLPTDRQASLADDRLAFIADQQDACVREYPRGFLRDGGFSRNQDPLFRPGCLRLPQDLLRVLPGHISFMPGQEAVPRKVIQRDPVDRLPALQEVERRVHMRPVVRAHAERGQIADSPFARPHFGNHFRNRIPGINVAGKNLLRDIVQYAAFFHAGPSDLSFFDFFHFAFVQ